MLRGNCTPELCTLALKPVITGLVFSFIGKRSDGLPDWVWSADGFEFYGWIPSCYDPTYCETDPPVPALSTTRYRNPPLATLKYKDGEVVTYTCTNPSKKKLWIGLTECTAAECLVFKPLSKYWNFLSNSLSIFLSFFFELLMQSQKVCREDWFIYIYTESG